MKSLSQNSNSGSLVPALSKWRDDITGLRALAVIPVVIYHAFPELIPGGFFGVDIFFVISGFLISNIIFKGFETGTFSWREFYARRVRRIVPNLSLVLLFVSVMGYLFMSSSELSSFGSDIYSGALFYENIHMLKIKGYFDNSAVSLPLLHLWSLAVEEQFYIVFPLVALFSAFVARKYHASWKRMKPMVLLALMLIVAGSFAYCMIDVSREHAFFFPLTRFWEIGVGILLCFLVRYYSLKVSGSNVISLCGFGLIVSAYFLYDKSIQTPGAYSLIPVFGAALLILAGENGIVNRTVLSVRAMVFVGLISYSLYLWHWPFLSFGKIVLGDDYTNWLSLLLIALSIFVSAIVFFYVEKPIIAMRKGRYARVSVYGCLACLLLFFAVGELYRVSGGLPGYGYRSAHAEFVDDSIGIELKTLPKCSVGGVTLRCTRPGQPLEVLFFGDSHSEQYVAKIKKLAERYDINVGIYAYGGCFVVPGVEAKEGCKRTQEGVVKLLGITDLKLVLWGQLWGYYNDTNKVYSVSGESYPLNAGGFKLALQNMGKILSNSEKSWYVIEDQPWGDGLKWREHINRLRYDSTQELVWDASSTSAWKKGNESLSEVFGEKMIKTAEYICPSEKCDCKNYLDANHLSPYYLQDNAFWLDPIFEKYFGHEAKK